MRRSSRRFGARMASAPAFFREARELRRGAERSKAMLWSRHVNRPLGSMIALALLPTRATPNMVSITGAVFHIVGSLVVLASPVPAPAIVAVVAFLLWEAALALDNADGQLARSRGVSSPFGAWLDQILDFVNHTVVVASLVWYAAQALSIAAPAAALLGALSLSGNLIGLFASAQRNALLGTQPALTPAAQERLRTLFLVRNATDYGAFLAVASLGLLWPPLLLVVLIVAPALTTALVVVQVAINWPRD